MATTTVAQLITNAASLADMLGSTGPSTFVAQSEWVIWLNSAMTELYDILIETFEDWNFISTLLAVSAATDTYALPADFYKLRGAEYLVSNAPGAYVVLRPFEWSERARFTTLSPSGLNATGWDLYYCLRGSGVSGAQANVASLTFAPYPTGAANIRVWYIQECPILTAGGNVVLPQGWEEYLAISAAAQALIKEESDPTNLLMRLAAMKERIVRMAPKRDADSPKGGIRRRGILYRGWNRRRS